MRKNIGGIRKHVILIALGSLVVFIAAAFFFMPSLTGLAWKGYYSVLLDRDADIREASEKLAEQGASDFLSAVTATVEFSDFDRMETLRVYDIPKRLHPEDPRLDDYLKGVPSLFQSGSGKEHILYVPATRSPLVLAAELRAAFRGYAWSIVEWHTGRMITLLALFIVVAGIVVYSTPGMRMASAALALPWLGFFAHGSPGGFAAGILLYVGAVYFLEEALPRFEHFLCYQESGFWTRGLTDRTVYGCLLGAGAFFLAIFPDGGLRALGPLLFGAAGTVVLASAMAMYKLERSGRREHRLFIPLAILPGNWRGGGSPFRIFAPLIIFCCLLAAPVVFRVTGRDGAVLVPRPQSESVRGSFSREDLRELWVLQRENPLPNFADYLCHRAFQQGFFHGYPREFPLPDSRVVLSRFTEAGGRIIRTEETLAKYDEAWYKEELNTAKNSGLGGLLLRQGAAGMSLEPVGRFAMGTAFLVLYGLLAMTVLLPLLFAGLGISSGSVPYLKSIDLRRKQQEA